MSPRRALGALLVLLCVPFLASCDRFVQKNFQQSVVKVFTTTRNVDYYEPWKTGSEIRLEGCGTLLEGNRILTTARMANKATFIEVQKFGQTQRFPAKVMKVARGLDLALLEVEDPSFAPGTEPVKLGKMPSPEAAILIQGGDEFSVKEARISGMDMVYSWEVTEYVPALIVNAEAGDKNDGCPAFHKGKFVGIAFRGWSTNEKMGTLQPVDLVQRFLRGVEAGDEGLLVDPGIYTEGLENKAMREFYGLPEGRSGVVVSQVLHTAAAGEVLKEGDVLTAIEGKSLDNKGYVKLESGLKVPGDHLVALHLPGEQIPMDLFRAGQEMKVEVPLGPFPKLVRNKGGSKEPGYLVMAGLVFVPLTANYFQTSEWNSFPPKMKDLYNRGEVTPERREVVVLSHVLPHPLNRGYERTLNMVVEKVNGMALGDMKDLVKALKAPAGRYHVIESSDHAWWGTRIVLEAGKAQAATEEVLRDHQIPSDRSKDLQEAPAGK